MQEIKILAFPCNEARVEHDSIKSTLNNPLPNAHIAEANVQIVQSTPPLIDAELANNQKHNPAHRERVHFHKCDKDNYREKTEARRKESDNHPLGENNIISEDDLESQRLYACTCLDKQCEELINQDIKSSEMNIVAFYLLHHYYDYVKGLGWEIPVAHGVYVGLAALFLALKVGPYTHTHCIPPPRTPAITLSVVIVNLLRCL